jgi:single-stranded DNA-binding protein
LLGAADEHLRARQRQALASARGPDVVENRQAIREQATWWQVTAFDEAADDLLKLEAGDAISISGSFTAEVYAKDGSEPRVSFRIIVDRIASPRLGKPKQRAGREVAEASWAPP